MLLDKSGIQSFPLEIQDFESENIYTEIVKMCMKLWNFKYVLADRKNISLLMYWWDTDWFYSHFGV